MLVLTPGAPSRYSKCPRSVKVKWFQPGSPFGSMISSYPVPLTAWQSVLKFQTFPVLVLVCVLNRNFSEIFVLEKMLLLFCNYFKTYFSSGLIQSAEPTSIPFSKSW